MKVKMMDFEEAAIGFAKKAIATMPTTGHKFLAGAMMLTKVKEMESFLSTFADAEGMIDTENVRSILKAGFDSVGVGSKVSFTIGDDKLAWMLKPVTVSFTGDDFEEMLKGVESKYRAACAT